MSKVLFAGCSYVAGNGFELHKNDPGLWVNLLHQNTQLKNFELINASRGGRSNAGIFQDAVWHLAKGDIEIAFVCWTCMPRYELDLGLETYDTRSVFIPNSPQRDHNLNTISYSKKYLDNIRDRFTSLAHVHREIVNLVYYVNSLVNLAKLANAKIFFVNSRCQWDNNYFQKLENVLPDQYTEFTKKNLNVDTRCDEEIFEIYNKMHREYAEAGGIQESHWLNLYNSLRSQIIDTNNDNTHPGYQSNQLYYKQFSQALTQKL